MKATELRIGNIINHITGEITVKSDDFEHIEKDPCEYMGIELTEEWLNRLGFNGIANGKYFIGFNYCEYSVQKVGDIYNKWYFNHEFDKTKRITSNIKYVHQLQNLYFALTGDELKISEK